MGKVSGYAENTTPTVDDFALGETASGPTTNRFKWSKIISLVFSAGFTTTTDANGWTVESHNGVAYSYRRRHTFSASIGTTPFTPTLSATSLPVGMSTLGTNTIQASIIAAGFAYDLQARLEMSTSSTAINWTARSASGTSRTYTGFIDIEIKP